MYIKKIEFTNFRGFQELSVDLPENLAVFIGWNGSGKTTILDGIYKFILAYIYEVVCDSEERINYKYLPNAAIQLDEIHNNEKYSTIFVKIVTDIWIDNSHEFFWILSSNQAVINNNTWQLYRYKERLHENFRQDEEYCFPITVYYQTSALKTPLPKQFIKAELIRNDVDGTFIFFSQYAAYENSKINEFDDYNDFKKWFKEYEDAENAVIVNNRNLDHRNDKLEIVEQH
ncbi:MAG: AAA family ATPase [Crocosphaera sp.]|nr:AAA family ATPase [Crocosphaera sp.]